MARTREKKGNKATIRRTSEGLTKYRVVDDKIIRVVQNKHAKAGKSWDGGKLPEFIGCTLLHF